MNSVEAVRTLLRTLNELGFAVETADEMLGRLAYSEADAAKMIGVSPRTLFNLRSEGKVKAIKIGSRVVYPRAALLAFLEAGVSDG